MTPDELRLIRKRCEEGTEVLAVADRRHLLAELDCLRSASAGAPLVGHGFTPGKFTPDSCQVMLARYPCPFTRNEHPDRPPEDIDAFGYRNRPDRPLSEENA